MSQSYMLEDSVMGQSLIAQKEIEFVLNAGDVIRGWDQGIAGMSIGGTWKLVCPPSGRMGSMNQNQIYPQMQLFISLLNSLQLKMYEKAEHTPRGSQ